MLNNRFQEKIWTNHSEAGLDYEECDCNVNTGNEHRQDSGKIFITNFRSDYIKVFVS